MERSITILIEVRPRIESGYTTADMPGVPRVGERIVFNYEDRRQAFTVDSVTWYPGESYDALLTVSRS